MFEFYHCSVYFFFIVFYLKSFIILLGKLSFETDMCDIFLQFFHTSQDMTKKYMGKTMLILTHTHTHTQNAACFSSVHVKMMKNCGKMYFCIVMCFLFIWTLCFVCIKCIPLAYELVSHSIIHIYLSIFEYYKLCQFCMSVFYAFILGIPLES